MLKKSSIKSSMKFVMYHYIRKYNSQYPYFNYLEKKTFNKQINYFKKIGLAENEVEIQNNKKKFILTFDDGLKDHIYAAETLKKKNSLGIFFIPTLPLKKGKFLDVHKSHLILGKMGGKISLERLQFYLKKKSINNFFNEKEKRKFSKQYSHQNDESDKVIFKKIINYYSDISKKSKLLDTLIIDFKVKVSLQDFYMNKDEIKYLSNLGMIIGSHAVNHNVLSRLSYSEQYKELKNSKECLEDVLGKKCDYFCYPYGWKNSYNKETITILKKLNYKNSFCVEDRDCSKKEFILNPYQIPRYDCNQFCN